MVKKFEEFINEGFLSKTYDRYRTGERRIEDRTVVDRFMDYITTIEWVDMSSGFLYAKYDFPEMLCVEDIIEIQKKLPKDIYMAGYKEYEFIKRTCNAEMSENNDGEPCIDEISGEFEDDDHFVSFNLYKDKNNKFKEQVHYLKNYKDYNNVQWYVSYDVVYPPGNQDRKPIGLFGFSSKIMEKNIFNYKTLCIKLCKEK